MGMLCGVWRSVPPPTVWHLAPLMAPSASGTPAAVVQAASVPSPCLEVSVEPVSHNRIQSLGLGVALEEAPSHRVGLAP